MLLEPGVAEVLLLPIRPVLGVCRSESMIMLPLGEGPASGSGDIMPLSTTVEDEEEFRL